MFGFATYANGEDRSNLIHAVPIGPLTYIFEFLWAPWQVELLVHELSKGLHPVGAPADADKLERGAR